VLRYAYDVKIPVSNDDIKTNDSPLESYSPTEKMINCFTIHCVLHWFKLGEDLFRAPFTLTFHFDFC
jgi:hypothetical protein